MGYSVSSNGTARALPSAANAPSQASEFPAFFTPSPLSVEMASLPFFDGLSEALYSAIRIPLDSQSEIVLFGGMVTDQNIFTRPKLTGSSQQRAFDPQKRPGNCTDCSTLKYVDYPMMLNIKRQMEFALPRLDISSSHTPVIISAGLNLKYLKSELEGGEDNGYISQNINMDGGVHLSLLLGYDLKTKKARRTLGVDVSGFELLQTSQVSSISEDKIQSRSHLLFYWNEDIGWNSQIKFAINQQSEFGKWPSLGVEGVFHKSLFLRFGGNEARLTGGVTLKYRFIALHYSFIHHDLGTNPYQIALEMLPFAF